MIAVIRPGMLRGTVEIPASKSYAHRLLIAAALADAPTRIGLNATNADIAATAACLRALGARIEPVGDGLRVQPIAAERRFQRGAEGGAEVAGTEAGADETKTVGAQRLDRADRKGAEVSADEAKTGGCCAPPSAGLSQARIVLDCGESGSTLRFLLPVAAALGAACAFTGSGRLPERPNAVLTEALNAHGACADRDRLPIHLSGRLRGGEYAIAGDVSSQYITGLLFALPLCREDSAVRLTTPLASASYVDITLDVLARFGVRAGRTAAGWAIPGGQCYASPGEIRAEGDWSAAAFWRVANRLGGDVRCAGLRADSAQGDRAIDRLLDRLGGTIDVADTPDLVPALAVAAAVHPGVTRITGAARLRLKESDRLRAVAGLLRALGGCAAETADGLEIRGVPRLTGGAVDGCNDHRIVMAAAVAATVAEGAVTISDAQAVEKSYPAFFDDFARLGGNAVLVP